MTAAPMNVPSEIGLHDALLVKPFKVNELRASIVEVLAKRTA